MLAVPVDDSAASEVVRRELDAHPVAQEHPDPVSLHLPGRVADQHVPVVQAEPEHPVAEGFDDLGFQLDFLFLFGDDDLLSIDAGARRRARDRERAQALLRSG